MTSGHMRIGTDALHKGQTSFAPENTTMSPFWLDTNLVNVATKVKHADLSKLFVDTYALKD
jgi:hypothetical protein